MREYVVMFGLMIVSVLAFIALIAFVYGVVFGVGYLVGLFLTLFVGDVAVMGLSLPVFTGLTAIVAKLIFRG